MAKSSKKAAAKPVPPKPAAAAVSAASVQPEGQYRVKLSRPVRVGDTLLRPFHDNIVKGKHIAAMGDAVTAIETV